MAPFDGEFVSFSAVRLNPKPVASAVSRLCWAATATLRCGVWPPGGTARYGFNLAGVEGVRERLSVLRRFCGEAGRDFGGLDLSVALASPAPDDLTELTEMGVSELVLVQSPPADPGTAEQWVAGLASSWHH